MRDTDDNLVRVNKPDNQLFSIEAVHRTETKFIIDVQKEKAPTPRMFSRASDAEVALVGMSGIIPSHVPEREALDDAIDAVQKFKRVLVSRRSGDLSKHQQSMLALGNIDELPEVARSREPNKLDMECPFCRGEDTYEDPEYQLHCFACGSKFTAHERERWQGRAKGNSTLIRVGEEA